MGKNKDKSKYTNGTKGTKINIFAALCMFLIFALCACVEKVTIEQTLPEKKGNEVADVQSVPTEKSSAIFLGYLAQQEDIRTDYLNLQAKIFVLDDLIARKNTGEKLDSLDFERKRKEILDGSQALKVKVLNLKSFVASHKSTLLENGVLPENANLDLENQILELDNIIAIMENNKLN